MKRLFFVLGLLVLALPAQAQQDYPRDLTLKITQPTQDVFGTLLDPGDLKDNRYECARNDGTIILTNEIKPVRADPGSWQTETWVGVIPQPGTYICFAYVSNIEGAESDASNPHDEKYIGKPLPGILSAAIAIIELTFT